MIVTTLRQRTCVRATDFFDGLASVAVLMTLRFHKLKPLSRQLEIETYTWDVLPDNLKTGDIVDYVCRELEWVRGQLV